ncbi:MAG: helix-turn-helix domain-containing protein [bacterium]
MENLNKKSLEDYPVTLNIPEVAEVLRINKTKAYELARRKDFPSMKLGNRIIVPKEAFKNWLDNQVKQDQTA